MFTPAIYVAAMPMASAVMGTVLLFLVWPDRTRPTGLPLLGLVASATIWAFFYALEILTPSLGAKVLMAQFQYVGIVFVAPSWCIAVARSIGAPQLMNRPRLALLLLIPVITLAAAFTNAYHGLLWSRTYLGEEPVSMLHMDHGPVFWLNNQYEWLLLAGGSFLLLRNAASHYQYMRAQGVFMVLVVLLPWLANAMYLLQIGPFPTLDLTPCAFIASSLVLYYGIARLKLTRVVPVARDFVVEHLREGLFVLDVEGKVLDANRTALALLPPDARDIIGDPAEHAFTSLPSLASLAAAESDAVCRFSPPTSPGMTIEASISTLRTASNAPIGRIVLCHDVSLQIEAEERIRESEARYRGYFDMGLIGMTINSVDKRFLSVNDYVCQLLGYSREELLQRTWADVTLPEDRGQNQEQFNRVIRGEIDGYAIEKRYLRSDGRIVIVDLWARGVRKADGSVDYFIAMLRDVTERVTAEEALRVSETKARSILNASTAGIALFDLEARVLDCNEVFARDFHLTRPEVLGRSVWEFSSVEARPRREAAFRQVVSSGEPLHAIDEREGIWNDFTLFPVKDEKGELTAVVLYLVEITDRIRLEREKESLTAQYQQAQRMEAIGQLAGGVAHDFNNLLQVIHGYAEVARAAVGDNPRADVALGRIEAAGDRAAALVRQLLAFSRRQVLQVKVLDLNEIVTETISMVQRLIGANIRLDFTPSANALPVEADAALLGQVLMNLCVNARDAMPGGGVLTISTGKTRIDAEATITRDSLYGEYATITVRDTGTGMDTDTLQHIFEPFFTTKEIGRGTGLGLATAYGIVKQHGGGITAQSEPGEGATFTVYLRLADRKPVAGPATDLAQKTAGSETILFAEDNAQVRELACSGLAQAGYRVLEAVDGREALELFNNHRDEIDLALLDVMMPELGGREVYEAIRRERPSLPVLFASGYHADGTHAGFILDEGLSLLPKPYRIHELLTAIRAKLGD